MLCKSLRTNTFIKENKAIFMWHDHKIITKYAITKTLNVWLR